MCGAWSLGFSSVWFLGLHFGYASVGIFVSAVLWMLQSFVKALVNHERSVYVSGVRALLLRPHCTFALQHSLKVVPTAYTPTRTVPEARGLQLTCVAEG